MSKNKRALATSSVCYAIAVNGIVMWKALPIFDALACWEHSSHALLNETAPLWEPKACSCVQWLFCTSRIARNDVQCLQCSECLEDADQFSWMFIIVHRFLRGVSRALPPKATRCFCLLCVHWWPWFLMPACWYSREVPEGAAVILLLSSVC